MPGLRVINNQYATLSFNGHEVSVVINGTGFTSPVVSISFDDNWQIAKLEDGSEVYFCWKNYADSIPFRNDVILEKYEAAIAAENALIAAEKAYIEALNALGAERKERGNYEDHQTWLEIPGIPNKKWLDK